jgi:hypothetical protein
VDMILTSNGQPTIKEGAFTSTNRQTTTDSVCAAIFLPRIVNCAGHCRLIAALCRRSPCSTTPRSRPLSKASQASSAQVLCRRPQANVCSPNPNVAPRTAAPRWIIPVNVRKERAGGGHSIGDASIAAT